MKEPTEIEKAIFDFADELRRTEEGLSLDELRKNIPLSARQLERKFKALIGTDIQTLIRISRFSAAHGLLHHQESLSLTHIGYEAGYYDQPHFSHDFKEISKISPKEFAPCTPVSDSKK